MKNLYKIILVSLAFIPSVLFGQNFNISGSNSHSVALCADGQVFAWGNNNLNQIGVRTDNSVYPNGSYNTPQRVFGLQEIFQIDAGSGGHTSVSYTHLTLPTTPYV